jgi:adenylate kinase
MELVQYERRSRHPDRRREERDRETIERMKESTRIAASFLFGFFAGVLFLLLIWPA